MTGCMSLYAFAASTIVRPGLWEITVTTRVSEVRTDPARPESFASGQQAKVPMGLAKPVVAPDVTHTLRECLTAAVARSWTALTKIDREYGACQMKPLARNARRYKVALTCAGGRASGDADFSATATEFQGEVRVVAHESSYDRTDTKIVRGRWLRANCGGSASASAHP
jgi:hypothetical protein